MDLVADPGVFNVIFVLKLIDNTLADIAEGSDVVEKNFHPDHAFPRLSFIFFTPSNPCEQIGSETELPSSISRKV
jgi:hypothetical protein